MTLVVEVVVDRGMDSGQLLQGLDVPEPGHRPFPPLKRLMRVLGSGVKPASAFPPSKTSEGTDAPICQDTRSGGLDDLSAWAEIGHNALVDLASEETFQAPDDLSLGSAVRRAACDVVNGRLMVPHADDDGSIEGGVGLSVAASIEAVPAGGHPGRDRDRARAAELREGGVRTNPVRVIAEDDQQLGRGVGAHPEALTEGR